MHYGTVERAIIKNATKAIMGEDVKYDERCEQDPGHVGVKSPQFSFHRLLESDPVLGVEMSSTGEVACFGESVEEAFLKSLKSSNINIPDRGSSVCICLKDSNNMVGFYETIHDITKNHAEIAYFGILEEYFGKKCGGYLLSEAIANLFEDGINRVWLHTCSLDHKNALKNYLARGMKIFKSEKISLDVN